MALSSKGWIVTAVGIVIVGAGGYIGAQALVGNEVEKALAQSFEELDQSASYDVSNVRIDKGTFNTTASATIAVRGFQGATAEVNLFVNHGVLSADITGDIQPNQELLTGSIDIDLEATRSSIEGQLTAAALSAVEVDAALSDLVVDLRREANGVWHVDSLAQEIIYNGDNETVRVITPRLVINTQAEGVYAVQQRLEVPRTEIFAEGVRVYLEGLESEAESTGEGAVVNQSGYFRIADIGADDTSFGSMSFDMVAENWDVEAFQSFQEAYTPLMTMHMEAEESGARIDEEEERVLMIQAIESGYDILIANPSIAFQPLEARITLPEFGVDFEPRLTAEVAFDGTDLSKSALYSALWGARYPLPEQLLEADDVMSPFEAQEYLSHRLSVAVTVTTPPDFILSMIPMPFAAMLDASSEEQQLLWQDGSLIINGQPIM
ncbi:DUF945 family protein [Vreelandella olivaria]|uniref:DUF945 family protein n=1 Tax=Vreelandella olivaria TaxID=390919 RepID=UPI00201FA476|nr:DUF945 family protein [Halomonas olivaria]